MAKQMGVPDVDIGVNASIYVLSLINAWYGLALHFPAGQ